MATAAAAAQPGQIWRDDCYYLDRKTGECQRKYLLALVVDPRSGDVVTAAFTSKPTGSWSRLRATQGRRVRVTSSVRRAACSRWPAGVDFNSLQDLDACDLTKLQRSGRMSLLPQTLPVPLLCAVLRCVLQSDDLTGRQARLIGDVAAVLRCP